MAARLPAGRLLASATRCSSAMLPARPPVPTFAASSPTVRFLPRSATAKRPPLLPLLPLQPSRAFSATAAAAAPPRARGPPGAFGGGGGPSVPRAKRLQAERDPKIKILDKALYKLKFVPPPLRMGRNRYLRHWTIHRAWLLLRRQRREARERELMQQYQSMANACEALRLSRGPGLRDEGYLYRVAMEKKGVYRHGGVPIEYARPQTETPALTPWNHGWKR